MDIKKQWTEYVRKWNTEKFGKEYEQCLGDESRDTYSDAKDYIMRCIADEEHLETMKLPLKRTYSKQGMTELQELTFLVEETAKELNHPFMASIIYDSYNIAHGAEKLKKIIGYYVDWKEEVASGAGALLA